MSTGASVRALFAPRQASVNVQISSAIFLKSLFQIILEHQFGGVALRLSPDLPSITWAGGTMKLICLAVPTAIASTLPHAGKLKAQSCAA